MTILTTERGWPGHFCAAYHCLFRRNTLLNNGITKIVISTVGAYKPTYSDRELESIGADRYYETMCWYAQENDAYNDADISRGQIDFASKWSISKAELGEYPDNLANLMHDNVVEEIKQRIITGELV